MCNGHGTVKATELDPSVAVGGWWRRVGDGRGKIARYLGLMAIKDILLFSLCVFSCR